ncbi:hypothetical protein Tco_0134698 [Tanacetum coccineum]
MHTRASNSELVEPLPEPKRTLNLTLRRQNRRVPYDQRNNPPQHPRIIYLPVLNINYFRHFLDILQNYDLIDDEPMWAADHVVAPTPGSAITILETANEFAIKGNYLTLVKGNQFDGRTKTDPHKHIHEFLGIYDMFKYRDIKNKAVRLMMFPLSLNGEAKNMAKSQKTKSSLKKTVAFADEGNSNSNTDKIMARMDAMTLKMDAQYKELQTHAKKTKPNLDEDNIPMYQEEEAKFMQTFLTIETTTDDKPYDLQKQFNDFMKSQQSTNAFVKEIFMDHKTQLETVVKNHQASIQNLETKFDRLDDKQSGRPSGSLPSNTQPNPKAHNSKAYQPPDDEDDEPTPQTKTQNPKSVKETLLPKPYKQKFPYPQRLRKEKMEAQFRKFLDMIRAVRINVPLIHVLVDMPNYGKFLKELISNKHKIEQISAAFLSVKVQQ